MDLQVKLQQWVEEHTSDLYSWANYKVSNDELAKDLVQDTFLAAAENAANFRGDSSPKTWLFSILNHKIIDHYRKQVKSTQKIDIQVFAFFEDGGEWMEACKPKKWDEEKNEQLLEDPDFQKVLQHCLDSLPDQWSTSVKLKYLLQKKGEDICQELGISPSNYWQIIHRAKLKLRDCVEKKWFL